MEMHSIVLCIVCSLASVATKARLSIPSWTAEAMGAHAFPDEWTHRLDKRHADEGAHVIVLHVLNGRIPCSFGSNEAAAVIVLHAPTRRVLRSFRHLILGMTQARMEETCHSARKEACDSHCQRRKSLTAHPGHVL